MELKHPIPANFPKKERVFLRKPFKRAGQLAHSWVSRFYNSQLAPGKLAIVFESWGSIIGGLLVVDQRTASWTHV